jgi:hypothetical protein
MGMESLSRVMADGQNDPALLEKKNPFSHLAIVTGIS